MSGTTNVRQCAKEVSGADRMPDAAAPVRALALIVSTRPDANDRWAAELRSIEAIDFYPRATS